MCEYVRGICRRTIISLNTCGYTNTYACPFAHAFIIARKRTHTYKQIYALTHKHTDTHTLMHLNTLPQSCIYICLYAHTHMFPKTHKYSHIYSY